MQPPASGVTRARSTTRSKLLNASLILIGFALLAFAVYTELNSSRLQARYFSGLAHDMKFVVEPGPSASIRFPQDGPYDHRLGYSEMPRFLERLQARGFEIDAQARLTRPLADLIEAGYAPPYPEKTQGGLQILDCRDEPLFQFAYPERVYADFGTVPPTVAQALLFIENRELLDDTYPTRNPAIEWTRLARAVGSQFMKVVDADYDAPGGSTLATQIEKYRHSPSGITNSIVDKLRQMYSATLRAYSRGPDTSAQRRQIGTRISEYGSARRGRRLRRGLGYRRWAVGLVRRRFPSRERASAPACRERTTRAERAGESLSPGFEPPDRATPADAFSWPGPRAPGHAHRQLPEAHRRARHHPGIPARRGTRRQTRFPHRPRLAPRHHPLLERRECHSQSPGDDDPDAAALRRRSTRPESDELDRRGHAGHRHGHASQAPGPRLREVRQPR